MDPVKHEIDKSLTKTFNELVESYLNINLANAKDDSSVSIMVDENQDQEFDLALEESTIKSFIETPCACGKSCQSKLSFKSIRQLALAGYRLADILNDILRNVENSKH